MPPGLPSALRGYIVGNSDFELNLQPPHENSQDIKEALDSLMKFENEKQAVVAESSAKDKQLMVTEAKAAIRSMVAAAFEPLRAKIQA